MVSFRALPPFVVLLAGAAATTIALGCSSAPGGEPNPSDPSDAGGGPPVLGEAGGPSIPGGPAAGSPRRYDFELDLAAPRSRSRVTAKLATGGDCFRLGSRRAAPADATWNGAPARSADLENDLLTVCGTPVPTGGELVVGATTEIPVQTFLDLDVGFSRKTDRAGGPFTYLLSWVGGCDRFGPCDPHPSRLVELHLGARHPEDQIVLCPGVRTVSGGETRCTIAGTLAPTYSGLAFAADPLWRRTAFTSAAGVDLVLFEVPGGTIGSSLDPASVREFLSWITTLLGPMPYGPELRVAGAPTRWLGFEHPANILLDEHLAERSTSYEDGPMHVLMHEIVHQYAGDRTTLAETEDFVWKEATAEYLAYVFEDDHRSPLEARSTRTYWDEVAPLSTHRPRPTDHPKVEAFYGDVYGPGPMVLYLQLEAFLGRPAILEAIRSFLAPGTARSVEDLRAALEAASGKSLRAYFDAWVFGPGAPAWPTFDVAVTPQAGQQLVTITQRTTSGVVFGCKVEVQLTTSSGSTARGIVDFGLAPTAASASTTIPVGGTVTTVRVDPDHRVIGRVAGVGTDAAPVASSPRVWIF